MKKLTKKQNRQFEKNFAEAKDVFMDMKSRHSCRSVNNGPDYDPIPTERGTKDEMLRAGFDILHMCGD